jgi:RHS repeat-associated protein
MPNRTYSAVDQYRYGFNGKENDNEVKGVGNQQDYGMRVYDPRMGKFLSVDPITIQYPQLTPYQFSSNTPIFAIDRDGKEFEPYWATTVPIKIREYEAELYRKDPSHAAQIIFHKNLNAFLFIGGALTAGWGVSAFSFTGTTATITNLSAQATIAYSTYSVTAANLGAFTVELLNPDPNGTPGMELFQGDEVARGLKLLFKRTVVPLIKPVEKFMISTDKLDYLFGKLKYQNLTGPELEAYAKADGRSVEKLTENKNRAASMAKVFEYWGIDDSREGFEKLSEFFNYGLNGKIVDTKVDQYGTSIKREIPLIFTEGPNKGKSAGSLQISYFYKNSDMSAVPEISSVIPIPDKKL